MENKYKLFLLLAIITLLVSGCTAQSPATEAVSTKTVELLKPNKPLESLTTANTPLSLKTEEIILTTPEITPTDQEETNKFTYYFDQKEIEQYCLEFPQLSIFHPIDIGNRYIVSVLEQNNISAVSPEDGNLTPLFTPGFPNGHLLGNIEFEYPWYTYTMVDSPSALGDWNLHVVNLDKNTNTIIANQEKYNSVSLHTYTSIDSGILYFSTSTFDGYDILSSQLYAFDLASKNAELLVDSQDKETFISIIAASNGYIVIENDPPKDEPVRHLTLFNVSNQAWLELPQDYPASMPDMEYPYVIWKNNERFEFPSSFTIYNLETGISRKVDVSGRSSYDLSISNGFVITQASTGKDFSRNSIMLYPIEDEYVYAIRIGIDEVSAKNAYINNGNVIWSFTTLANAYEYSSFLCKVPLETVLSEALEGIED